MNIREYIRALEKMAAEHGDDVMVVAAYGQPELGCKTALSEPSEPEARFLQKGSATELRDNHEHESWRGTKVVVV